MQLLHIDSSVLGEASVSRELSAEIVATLQQHGADINIVRRDLGETPLGHFTGAHFMAFQGQMPDDTALHADINAGTAALEEFLAADTIVIGAPMYNFSIPSQLKSWIDRISVAGKTFHYTENGPEGLAGGKKVIIAISRGGFYGKDTPMADFEHQESYLRAVFSFLGITDFTVIRAEGIALGPDQREQSIKAATDLIKSELAD